MIIKDISWLWRTAYNCANQGCAEWDDAEERVPRLFSIAGQVREYSSSRLGLSTHEWDWQLIEAYREVVVQVDEEVYMALIFSSFAAISARGKSTFLCQPIYPNT